MGAAAAIAAPSRDLSTYVLVGGDGIRARGLRILHGDIGVNQGSLLVHDTLDGPDSMLAGDVVSVGGRSRCAGLFFAGAVNHTAPGCGPGAPYTGPLFADLAAACGVPDEFPDCAQGAAIRIAPGAEHVLAPGGYGEVDVGGTGSHPGRLVLTGGRYVFCSLRTHRRAVVEADAATQVFVVGDVSIGPRSEVGPKAPLAADDLEVFSNGSRFAVSRGGDLSARVCALDATLHVTGGSTLTGGFVARRVVAARITLAGVQSGSSTTSTTTSTSSTTSSSSEPPTTSSTTATPSSTTTTSTIPAPSTTTTTTLGSGSTTSSTAPTSSTTTTTTATSSTSSTTSSTTTLATGSTTSSTASTSSTTTTTITTTTTSSTTSTTLTSTTSSTTTTVPSHVSCPASGQIDVIATLVPDVDTFSSGQVGGIEVDFVYPASVSMPGTQFLPVNDPSDPATLIALLSATPGQINLYDGLLTFFDADSMAPLTLRTVLTLNLTSNLIFNQTVPFERARFTCSAGAELSVSDFACTIPQEVNTLGGTVPPSARPPCELTLAVP